MNTTHWIDQSAEKPLIEKAANGDGDSFNFLVIAYQDAAFNLAYALTGDYGLAEDATQESFIKAYRSMHQFNGGSFRAWLLKITTNTSIDMLRRSIRRPTIPLISEDENGDIGEPRWLIDPGPSVQATVEQKELTKKIFHLLNELPDVYQNVITLIDLNGIDYAEAAEILSLPLGTIKSRLARARMQLKKKLMDDEGRVSGKAKQDFGSGLGSRLTRVESFH